MRNVKRASSATEAGREAELAADVATLRQLIRYSRFEFRELVDAYVLEAVRRGSVKARKNGFAYAIDPSMWNIDDIPHGPGFSGEAERRRAAWIEKSKRWTREELTESVADGREKDALEFLLRNGKAQLTAFEALGVELTDIGVIDLVVLGRYRDSLAIICDALRAPHKVLENTRFLMQAIAHQIAQRSTWEIALENAIRVADPSTSGRRQVELVLGVFKESTGDPTAPGGLRSPTPAQIRSAAAFMATLRLRDRKTNPHTSKRGPGLSIRSAAMQFAAYFGADGRSERKESRVKRRKSPR